MNFEKIAVDIMVEICETDEICESFDMDLIDAGLIDSMSIISLILAVEEKLGIKLQPTDIEKEDISTINSFIVFLKQKVTQ